MSPMASSVPGAIDPSSLATGAQLLQQEKDAKSAGIKTLATGAIAGAAAGAAAGSIVPGIGTLIGAGVGAIAGAVPGIMALVPGLEGGRSKGARFSSFDQMIEQDAAAIPDATKAVQAASVQIARFQQLAAHAPVGPITDAATAANLALSEAGNAVVDDVNTYQQGKAQINPWSMTAAGQSVGKIGPDADVLRSALASATSANDALAASMGVS